jgi:predicted ester cyclase
MSQQNEMVVRRLIDEGWNRGNLSVVDDCVSPSCESYGPMDSARGPEGIKSTIMKYRTAFPDCHLEVLDMFTAGDRVVSRLRYRGTHRGEFNGLAPTGHSVSGEVIGIDRLREGRIVESRAQWDALSLMQQLGVVTLPGRAKGATM